MIGDVLVGLGTVAAVCLLAVAPVVAVAAVDARAEQRRRARSETGTDVEDGVMLTARGASGTLGTTARERAQGPAQPAGGSG